MARKKAEVSDCLANALHKAGSVLWKPVEICVVCSQVKLNHTERLQKKLQHCEFKTLYKKALVEASNELHNLADEIHAKFPNISRLKDSSKDISSYSAFVSAEMEALNTDKWAAMSKEGWVAATKDHVEPGTTKSQDISANPNTSMSISHIKEALMHLNSCTRDESILIICQGSITCFHAPKYFCSSQKAEKFLTTVIKISSEDMSYKMDAFMTISIEGVAQNQVQVLTNLKASTASLILKKLKEAGGRHAIKKMYYINFKVGPWHHSPIWMLQQNEGQKDKTIAQTNGHKPHVPSPIATPAFGIATPSMQQDSQPAASSLDLNFVFMHMVTNQNSEAESPVTRRQELEGFWSLLAVMGL
ncbi:hypothetical protein EV360DRAFT_73557 [Lentinula raphanica]|nr:hypothetical protein EV360DRAFT_73557 [Lentinula raphanica]